MERWVLLRKGGDFQAMGAHFGISPRLACLIRNREVVGEDQMERYLNGTIADLYDGMLMRDMDRAVDILREKISEGKKIRAWNGLGQRWTATSRTGSGTATG